MSPQAPAPLPELVPLWWFDGLELLLLLFALELAAFPAAVAPPPGAPLLAPPPEGPTGPGCWTPSSPAAAALVPEYRAEEKKSEKEKKQN